MTPRRGPGGSLSVLSLFTGAGGLDLGLEAAGFSIKGCVERDHDCRLTIAANGSWPLSAEGDIEQVSVEALLDGFRLEPGGLDLVAGGPPCQPFSKSGLWRGGTVARMSDPRANAFRRFFEVVDGSLPRVMLLENVRGLLTPSSSPDEVNALDVLHLALDETNRRHGTRYEPHVLKLEAADYGVPQKRERVFVVAEREGGLFRTPVPTHGDGHQFPRRSNAWDAIGDLDRPDWDSSLDATGRWAELLPSIPEGRNYLWHTDRQGGEALFGWRTKYWSFLLKLAKAQPSWTLQAQPGPATGPFHWRSRRLSVREMARLQTFPDHHTFSGTYASVRRQIGNAVPAALGEVLGLEIRRQLFRQSTGGVVPTLAPVHRADLPPPEQPMAVPQAYLGLRGTHAEHPGVGSGPGAISFS